LPVLARPLGAPDFDSWWPLRLRMLAEHPEAFGFSHEEAVALPIAQHRERFLQAARVRPRCCAIGEALVGAVGCFRKHGMKERHKASVWGLYVAPEARGHGVGRALMETALARAREWPGLQQIHLAVTTVNEPARRLYRALGFEVYGVEPAAFEVDGRDRDEEHMLLR
jgi:ribosomal protein S18 acetylase RimI-like enzyme